MQALVTCSFGLSSLLNHELKKLKFSPINTFETGTFVETDWNGIYRLNLWSRIANKVYVALGVKAVTTFDEVFDFLQTIPFGNYLTSDSISVQVTSKYSQLHSEKSLQSIAHKSILKTLGITHFTEEKKEKEKKSDFEIFLHLENDVLRVYLNTSGNSLHQRGRRKQTGPAPLKENIAAAMILLSLWKFNQPFLDPFCGSGTLAIEAALLAKNGAPGKGRVFDFQKFKNFEPNARNLLLEDAKKGEFSKDYQIFARDIDETVLEYAKMNAENAGVQSCIHFEKCDFLSDFSSFTPPLSENLRLVTNPPYGKRLNADENLDPLYQKLAFCLKTCKGGVISSYPGMKQFFNDKDLSHKQLYNGADEVDFYRKKIG